VAEGDPFNWISERVSITVGGVRSSGVKRPRFEAVKDWKRREPTGCVGGLSQEASRGHY